MISEMQIEITCYNKFTRSSGSNRKDSLAPVCGHFGYAQERHANIFGWDKSFSQLPSIYISFPLFSIHKKAP